MLWNKEAKRKVLDRYKNEIKATPEIVEERPSENGHSDYSKVLLRKQSDLICSYKHEL